MVRKKAKAKAKAAARAEAKAKGPLLRLEPLKETNQRHSYA